MIGALANAAYVHPAPVAVALFTWCVPDKADLLPVVCERSPG